MQNYFETRLSTKIFVFFHSCVWTKGNFSFETLTSSHPMFIQLELSDTQTRIQTLSLRQNSLTKYTFLQRVLHSRMLYWVLDFKLFIMFLALKTIRHRVELLLRCAPFIYDLLVFNNLYCIFHCESINNIRDWITFVKSKI